MSKQFPGDDHPAAQANIKSFAAATAGKKEDWLALFDDAAVIQDPVGKSDMDPSGEGHRGKEAISQFWDMAIGSGNLSFDVKQRLPRADECAVLALVRNKMAGGAALETEMIVLYKVNSSGKIISLRAFWDYEGAMAQLGGATF
jgi:ketosteroid isomerase-like protein